MFRLQPHKMHDLPVLSPALMVCYLPHGLVILSHLGSGLDERALAAVSQWRFKPATKEGKPVKCHATVEVTFRLQGRTYDAKAEERRTQFNTMATLLARQKDGTLSDDHVKTVQSLADHKMAAAEHVVGLWELTGDVLPKNQSDALLRIQQAAKQDYGPSLLFLGNAQIEGTLLPKNTEKGVALLRRAAKLGNAGAQFSLGKRYLNGDGVTIDRDRARDYLQLCAVAGKPECQWQLGQLLLALQQRKEQDWLQAIAWLELAASHQLEAARPMLESERAKLTPEQAKSVAQRKNQLEHPRVPYER